jgi:hypothetical protein
MGFDLTRVNTKRCKSQERTLSSYTDINGLHCICMQVRKLTTEHETLSTG